MSGDIHFDDGDNFVLIIDTNLYSGNFHREMAAYLLNAAALLGFGDGPTAENEDFQDAAAEDPRLWVMQDMVGIRTHTEYGDTTNDIWATPGRLNDGMGHHFDAAPGQKGYPAFESVAIFLEAPFNAEQLELIKSRAEAFAADYQPRFSASTDKMKIVGVRQVNIQVKRTETIVETPL